uniref:Conserved plasma membrane protein n=1 Tax=Heterorhabditis bacteriophora TaxID=37862 RepID=A0A1I7XCX0_HETBA
MDQFQVPPCHPTFLNENAENSTKNSYSPPVYLSEPSEVQEDHVTFLFGILVLMVIALGCTFTLSKLTKPKIAVGYGNISSYDFMMWMPSTQNSRRSSMLVLLHGIACRRRMNANRSSTVSVVSSNIGLLPSYQTATSTPSSATTSLPPPPYSETQRLTEDNNLA